MDNFVLLEKHWLSSRRQERVSKFGPKLVSPYEVLEKRNNNFVINLDGERKVVVQLDQVRICKFKENDGSHLSGGVLHIPRSNESTYSDLTVPGDTLHAKEAQNVSSVKLCGKRKHSAYKLQTQQYGERVKKLVGSSMMPGALPTKMQ